MLLGFVTNARREHFRVDKIGARENTGSYKDRHGCRRVAIFAYATCARAPNFFLFILRSMVLFGWTNDGGGLQPSTAARPAPGHKRRDVNKRKGGKRHTGADHRQACTVGLGPDITETTWSIQKVIFKSYM